MIFPLIVIVGPTASGKSRLAIELASEWGTEIISADSRLIYKGMDIGTAKPTPFEFKGVKHHLIDIVNPDQSFSVGDYKRNVDRVFLDHKEQGMSLPLILAGGTGLYVKSVLYGLWNGPPADWAMRNFLMFQEEKSKGTLFRELMAADPQSAGRIHPNDLSKIIRALEVFHLTGKPLSYFHSEHQFQDRERPFLMIGIRTERMELYRRIEARADEMIKKGWIEEVECLMKNGYHDQLPAMHSLGYDLLCRFIKGSLSKNEAIQTIKKETRRYAKRQMTWFNKDPNVQWIDGNDPVRGAKQIMEAHCRGAVVGD
ncbi:MAG: tRNA (adenosine(37)-N6)-dimethylallyltransferase MiaA [Nitrospiria bacterium]